MTAEPVETLREQRDRAWERVCRVASTRWDITKFERADDDYRRACRDHGVPYIEPTNSTTVREGEQ